MIYLDHNATAPVIPAAREAVLRALETLGNPSSHHAAGRAARAIIEEAREHVAASVAASPREIVFTSGGTEAIHLGIVGAARAARRAGAPARVIASRTEHSAVLAALDLLVAEGFEGLLPSIDEHGRVTGERLAPLLRAGAALVALSSANNETGARQAVPSLAALCRERGALFFCDAVQSYGKEPLDARALGADLVALSAHKIGGPHGAGALYVREGSPLEPLLRGTQERERRAGTENTPGIAGMGAAARSVGDRLGAAGRIRALRDRLLEGLRRSLPGDAMLVNGPPPDGLPNTLNASFPGVNGDALRVALDLEGIAVSGGSACASGATLPSHVLTAIGRTEAEARSAVRFSLGPETTASEIEEATRRVAAIVRRLERVPR